MRVDGRERNKEKHWNVLMHMCESSTSFHCIKREKGKKGRKKYIGCTQSEKKIASMEDVMRILFWRSLGLSGLMVDYFCKVIFLKVLLLFFLKKRAILMVVPQVIQLEWPYVSLSDHCPAGLLVCRFAFLPVYQSFFNSVLFFDWMFVLSSLFICTAPFYEALPPSV